MEREFAAYAAEQGWAEAFRKYSTPDGQMAGARGIATTAAALEGAPAGDRSLAWWPVLAGIARSGDFGFTTGSFSIDATRAPRGQYFTVWKRQPDGSWRWIFDGGPGSVLDPVAEGPPDSAVAAIPVAAQGTGSAVEAVRQVQALEAGIPTAGDLAPHLAADARVFRRKRPRAEGGAASVENSRFPDPAIRFHLVRTEASGAGDLAFTLGEASWQAEGVARAGAFGRIWQFRDGRWVIVYDQLVEQPPPQPAAAAATTSAAATPAGCAAPGFHALDFWIGQWRVATAGGQPVGRNRIEPTLAGCALLEHWRGYSPQTCRDQDGLGVHRYDAASGTWRQAWMTDTGLGYDLVGQVQGNTVVYERSGPDGQLAGRSTLTPSPDGTVRQTGESRDPASGAWQTNFDFIYTREQ
jgi:ketosteroid isomerase-like protein